MGKTNYLVKVFILSTLFVLLIELVGPYRYLNISVPGMAYFLLCSILFSFGMYLSNASFGGLYSEFGKRQNSYCLTLFGERTLVVLSGISLLCAIFYLLLLLKYSGGIHGLGDYRYLVTQIRSNKTRFLEAFMHLSTPSYIIAASASHKMNKNKMNIITVSFWVTPLFFLLLGARWSIFYCIVIFFHIGREKRSFKKKKINPLYIVCIIAFFVIVLAIVYKLFAVRGNTNPSQQFLNEEGDMVLRSFWEICYVSSNGALAPIYKIFQYFGHSIANFCYVYDNYDSSIPKLYGLSDFQIVQYFLIPFGYSTEWYKEIVLSHPGAGSYKTFLATFIIDWGLFGSVIASFLFGLFFSRVERYRNSSLLACTFYPISVCMILCAPICGIWVSSSNMDLFFAFLITIFIKIFGGVVYREKQ